MPLLIPLAAMAAIAAYLLRHPTTKPKPVLVAKAKARAKAAAAKPKYDPSGAPVPQKHAWKEIHAPFLMTPKGYYRAAVSLHGLEPLASNNTIAEKLIKLGFSRVKVTGTGGTRIATGIYQGKQKKMASLDKHITRMWRWS